MKVETLAHGYGLLEGPRVDEHNRLYFSDVPNGGVYRRSPDGKIETVITERRGRRRNRVQRGGGIVMQRAQHYLFDETTGKAATCSPNGKARDQGLNDLHRRSQGASLSVRSNSTR